MTTPFTHQQTTALRARFPQLESAIYLAACSYAPLSLEVLAAIKRYERSFVRDGVAWESWRAEMKHTRAAFARLIGAQTQECALFSSVNEALFALIRCLPWRGREQVVSATPYGATVASGDRHHAVTHVDAPNGQWNAALVKPALNAHTALLSVSLVSFTTAQRQPLEELAELAHQSGALLMVDASHALGAMPFAVQDTGIDLLVCGAHTYLLGLPGLAFGYVRPGLALIPTIKGAPAYGNPSQGVTEGKDTAEDEDSEHTLPIVQAYAAHASLRWIEHLGVPAIAQHLTWLTQRTIQEALARGFTVAGPLDPAQRGPFVALRVGPQARQMADKMARLGVQVAAYQDLLRLAPGFYTSEQDMELALDILADVRERDLPGLHQPTRLARRGPQARSK